MLRPWLIFAVLLLLSPVRAAASECSPAAGQDRIVLPNFPDPGERARQASGFELLTAREQKREEWCGSGSLPLDACTVAPRRVRRSAVARVPTGAAAVEGCTSVCELLPYDATAPPVTRRKA